MRDRPRTKVDFTKHDLVIMKTDYPEGSMEDKLMGMQVHMLVKGDSMIHKVKFVNTNNRCIVTGDFHDWVLCRRFVPSADGYVSDGYWEEKIHIANSNVKTEDFSSDLTKARILELMDEESDYSEEETEYLQECLDNVE